MARIGSLPGGEQTTPGATDKMIIEPSGGTTKYIQYTNIAGDIDDRWKYGCRLYLTAATTSESSGSTFSTTLSGYTETFDHGGFYASGSNIVIPSGLGGVYVIYGIVVFDGTAATYSVGARLTVAGSAYAIATHQSSGIAAQDSRIHVSCIASLAATNTINLQCYQNSGGAIDIIGGGTSQTQLGCYLLART